MSDHDPAVETWEGVVGWPVCPACGLTYAVHFEGQYTCSQGHTWRLAKTDNEE